MNSSEELSGQSTGSYEASSKSEKKPKDILNDFGSLLLIFKFLQQLLQNTLCTQAKWNTTFFHLELFRDSPFFLWFVGPNRSLVTGNQRNRSRQSKNGPCPSDRKPSFMQLP